MMPYRKTAALIDLDAIRANVATIRRTYPGYAHYLGVVKADSYGLGTEPVIRAIVEGGCDYLCVSLAEEGLDVRKYLPEVPVMILVPVSDEALPVLARESVAVSVATREQAVAASRVAGLKVFIRANGGDDLFGGPTTREGFEQVYDLLMGSPAVVEGIYLHTFNTEDADLTGQEYALFEDMTAGIDLTVIPVVSTSNSLSMPRYPKKPYCNASRIGNIIYGIENESEELKNCFVLRSEVMDIVHLAQGQSIGYGQAYTATTRDETIAVVPIGYGDGFPKINAGRDVYVGDRRYTILTVTMDVTLLLVDESVRPGDEVLLIRDARHLDEIALHNHGVAEEAISLLNQRIPRVYRSSR